MGSLEITPVNVRSVNTLVIFNCYLETSFNLLLQCHGISSFTILPNAFCFLCHRAQVSNGFGTMEMGCIV